MATASGIPDSHQGLIQSIKCTICLNEQHDPRLLSCRHIYCYKCLKDYHEKKNHGNALPCPQCKTVTTLYQDSVDILPKFFFMNELKEVAIAKDKVRKVKPQKHRCVVCSTGKCHQPGLKYCKKCEFLCHDDHSKPGITKSHEVIVASEGESFTKSKVPPYPPCHRHKDYIIDLYCSTCNIPVCISCSQSDHRDHDCCDLDKQAEVCKTKLEQLCEDTDELIGVVKKNIDNIKCQQKQADADIDVACDSVKSTFNLKLDKEEKKLLTSLRDVRRHAKKTIDATIDSQIMTLANIENLKSCQVKLAEKNNNYNYVTVTDFIEKDVKTHFSKELPVVRWTSLIVIARKSGHQKTVNMPEKYTRKRLLNIMQESVGTEYLKLRRSDEQVEVKEVGRIRLQEAVVSGMVVYNQRLYVLHDTQLIVYCYTPDGSLSHKYEHKGGANIRGMCLVVYEDTPMLVLSDVNHSSLIWIKINDDISMSHHRTQRLHYSPHRSYNDRGVLMVSDPASHKIHRYRHDGQTLAVVKLPDDVIPMWITRHGDGEHYVVSDWWREKVVIVDGRGQMKKRYKGDIQSMKLGRPRDVITDPYRGVLIADNRLNQVLLLRKSGDVVKLLDQHVTSPDTMYLDTDHQRLYVSGRDQQDVHHVFIFNYAVLTDINELTVKVTKLNMKLEL